MSGGANEPIWLTSVIEDFEAVEPLVRADAPDAVHKARALTRRLRALFAVVPGRRAERAAEALRGYGRLLGKARDLEVYADRADEFIAGAGAEESAAEEARERLVGRTRERRVRAFRRIAEFLDGDRYRELIRLVERAAEDAEGIDPLVLLHEARKAARAVRYLGEAYGDAEIGAAGEHLQEVLGEHRDNTLLARSLAGEGGIYAAIREQAQARADALVPRR